MPVTSCQLCGSDALELALDLGLHPLADTFLKKEQLNESDERFPLQCLRCKACGHAMNSYIVPATKRYQENDYSYDSGNSKVAVSHFKELAADVIQKRHLSSDDLVVDIGGNVGTLLAAFNEACGAQILNVEPAPNIAAVSEKNGIPTIQDFFNAAVAKNIAEKGGASAITSTNSFNHISDLNEFVENIGTALQPDGVFVFEVPYLLPLIQMTAFDTMYLEHISYFSVTPLAAYFKKKGMVIADIVENDYMGGSMRMSVGKSGAEFPELEQWIVRETKEKLFEDDTYAQFRGRVEDFKSSLMAELTAAKKGGGRLIGIGAATKGNTLLNYCGITKDLIEFITDASPYKIGKYTPGSHILIQPDEAITDAITHALILPWNIGEFLKLKLSPKYPRIAFITPHVE